MYKRKFSINCSIRPVHTMGHDSVRIRTHFGRSIHTVGQVRARTRTQARCVKLCTRGSNISDVEVFTLEAVCEEIVQRG
jgi:hypothetical protein